MAFQRTTVPGTSSLGETTAPILPVVEDLLPHPTAGSGQAEPVNESGTTEVTEFGSAEVPDSVSEETPPKWQTLERKEVRLRADQLANLTELRRQVSAQRKNKSEIITDNTLIRLAVDFLLVQGAWRLKGDTEDELRRSLARKSTVRRTAPEGGQ